MDKLIKYILTAIIGGIIVFFLMKQCEEDPNIALHRILMIQHQQVIDSLGTLKEQIILSADSIVIERQTTIINKYNYVYETIDSIIYIDSTNANRVIRAWADSIRQVLEQVTDNIGVSFYWEITPDSISTE